MYNSITIVHNGTIFENHLLRYFFNCCIPNAGYLYTISHTILNSTLQVLTDKNGFVVDMYWNVYLDLPHDGDPEKFLKDRMTCTKCRNLVMTKDNYETLLSLIRLGSTVSTFNIILSEMGYVIS